MHQVGGHIHFLHSNADMTMGGRPFNIFFNIPNIQFPSIKIRFVVMDTTTNVLGSIFWPSIPMHKNMYLNYMLQMNDLIHTNYLGSQLSWVTIILQKFITLFTHPYSDHS